MCLVVSGYLIKLRNRTPNRLHVARFHPTVAPHLAPHECGFCRTAGGRIEGVGRTTRTRHGPVGLPPGGNDIPSPPALPIRREGGRAPVAPAGKAVAGSWPDS